MVNLQDTVGVTVEIGIDGLLVPVESESMEVVGEAGYFRDGVAAKPWSDTSQRASSEFYDNKGQWWSTWGEWSTFQIDSVKVWDLTPNSPQDEPESVKIAKKEAIISSE